MPLLSGQLGSAQLGTAQLGMALALGAEAPPTPPSGTTIISQLQIGVIVLPDVYQMMGFVPSE
jgi:hypothetical protein